ncbi:MAG: hypothetical protein AAFQ63_20395 [Cyanobacteria bacterium J06621_11]
MRLSALSPRRFLIPVLSGPLLAGCLGDSEIHPIPIFPSGGGSLPSKPAPVQ